MKLVIKNLLDKLTYTCYNGFMENFSYFQNEFSTRKGHVIPGATIIIDELNFAPATLRISDCTHTDDFNRETSTLEACFLSEKNFNEFEKKYQPSPAEALLIEFRDFMFKNSEEYFIFIIKRSELHNLKKLIYHETSHLLYKFDSNFKKLADKLTSNNLTAFKEGINNELKERGYQTSEFSDETCAFMMDGEFPPPANNLKLYFKLRKILKDTVRETFRDLYEIFYQKIALKDV